MPCWRRSEPASTAAPSTWRRQVAPGGRAVSTAWAQGPVNRGPAELELVVAELDCADEAAQIEGALGRLPAVTGVRTSVGAHKVFVTYDPAEIDPARIRATIEGLGMTVRMDRPSPSARRTPLPTLLGGLFVTAVALVALVGILGERLGLVEAVTERSRRGSRSRRS